MTRVAVVGLGLIGGSAALALRARGYDADPEARARARNRGIEALDTLAEALSGAEIILTAVPTAATPQLLRDVSSQSPAAILTDTASLKVPIVQAASSLPPEARFVAGHPMAGSRRSGVEAATPELFRGRPWILTRTARTDEAAFAAVAGLVRDVGARVVPLDAERHDGLMTWLSHAPLAVAAALARAAEESAGPGLGELAGPGFLGTTRVAAQPHALALELALADPRALADAIDRIQGELGALSAALRRGDAAAVADYLERAGALRRALDPAG